MEEVANKPTTKWSSFSEEEFTSTIANCNNSSTLGSNKLLWRHLKRCVKDVTCLKRFINIANTCIDLGHWPLHFKVLTTIIIFKPNKKSYNFLKAFCSIVLLNMLGKLIEKFIGERLQFQAILNNFVYQCQLGGLK